MPRGTHLGCNARASVAKLLTPSVLNIAAQEAKTPRERYGLIFASALLVSTSIRLARYSAEAWMSLSSSRPS